MSQSTQLPWRRRCTLDLLFHCEGRPGVILGSPIELAVCHWKADSIAQRCSVLAQFPQKLEVS